MKIATWNINSLKVRLPHVLAWLTEHQPDVLALQELKMTNEVFPVAPLQDAGYYACFAGQKTYNGVALLSKQPATDVQIQMPNFPDEQQRVIAASIAGVRVVNLYVPNGQSVGSDKYQYKLAWLEALTDYLRQILSTHPQVAIMGDFNIAPSDRDVYSPELLAGQVLVSDAERAAWQALLDLGLYDSFRLFEQADKLYSWWDYRNLAFRRNHGLRIDHILLNQILKERCKASYIDKLPRKLEQPSDHTPVVCELSL